ncbi:MAG: hypothetical protein M1438_10920 [Deltaproteobacteria bacterium]|nr:hypothetical protein [Deltaproteobacteria bacterium]
MIVYVTESGSDRTELIETLVKEGVTYQECKSKTEREAGAAVGIVEIQANIPEVVPVPRDLTHGDGDIRVWRLPSGKLVITDLNGNLEEIAQPIPPR